MHCATCGRKLERESAYCPACGASTSEVPASLPRCPRCGYRGEGIGFFRRPAHFGLLALFGLFTYGFGALVYWLLRRNDQACPACGLRWSSDELRLDEGAASTGKKVMGETLPPDGGGRRGLGIALMLVALLLTVIGLAEWELTAVAVGGFFAVSGGGAFWWGLRARDRRHEALLTAMQRKVLRLAATTEGRLTATEVAANLDLGLHAAERILISMDDGFRVRSEITEEGVLVYEFPEIRHRRRVEGSEGVEESDRDDPPRIREVG